MSKNNQVVVGVRPVRMKPLTEAMIRGFMVDERYQTRILPHLKTAVLLPVTHESAKKDGLMQKPGTNLFLPRGV